MTILQESIIDMAKQKVKGAWDYAKKNPGKVALGLAAAGAGAYGAYKGTKAYQVHHDNETLKHNINQFESSGKQHNVPYNDGKGIKTIGDGVNLNSLNPEERKTLNIPDNIHSTKEISAYLEKHPINSEINSKLVDSKLDTAKHDVERIFGKKFEDMQSNTRKLLVDMDYNMGSKSLSGFHHAIADYKVHGANDQFYKDLQDSKYFKEQLPKNHARFEYDKQLINGGSGDYSKPAAAIGGLASGALGLAAANYLGRKKQKETKKPV